MDQNYVLPRTSPQLSNLRQNISARQPVSCEPCRHRKIRCSRTKPTCETCIRRRCVDRCVYKNVRDGDNQNSAPSSNHELLDRISALEQLLRKRTGSEIPGRTDDSSIMPSPPIEMSQGAQLSPESFLSDTSNQTCSSDHQSPSSGGVLTSTSSGNVRFDFAPSQWTSVLANTNLSIDTPSLEDQEETDVGFGFPFTHSSAPSLDELLSLLPPMQQCDYLKNQYFAVFSPLFHILHDPTFHSQYTQFVDHPSSTPASWLAILFVLLSLAVTGLEDEDPVLRDLARGPDPFTNIRVLSRRYREAAMKCLANQGVFWGKHNVQSLQALIMLIYAMGHSQDHTWVLLGMTYNVATALACHIDPSMFNLDEIQCEERRRCWAGLMMLYTIQSTVMGNPDPTFRTSSSVKLPADVNDTDITLTMIQDPMAGPTQMSYLLFKFSLYNLTKQICRETFSSFEPRHSVIQNLDQQICLAQETWDGRYIADSTFEALPTHHAVHLHILHAYAHQLFLLLHRPFFARSILGLEIPNESQIRCIASAEALLDIHRILVTTPEYRPYMWYTNGLGSFHAFHAAAVLAVALLMPIYRPQYRKFRGVLEDTLGRFEKMARRSKICEKGSRILRFLLCVFFPWNDVFNVFAPANIYRSAPSPNQSLLSTGQSRREESTDERDDWLGTDQLKLFTERLQPQQWLGPSNIAWTEWDNLMTHMDGIRA